MKTIIIISFFILQALNAIGQDFWEEVILPDSITPASVSFNSEPHIYLSSSHGLYKSTDEGITWNLLLNYIAGLSVIINEANEIFVGIDVWGHLFYSINDGMSWDTLNSDITGASLKMTHDNTLFGLDWGKIYRSPDYGCTWSLVHLTVNGEIFNDLIEEKDTLFAGSTNFLDPSAGGVYQSLDSGNSWQHISLPGYGVSSFALDLDSNLLCGVRFQYYGQEYGVFRSVDNGLNWNNILSGYIITSLAVDVNGGIYAGCDSDFGPEGVQYSSDNGLSWESINSGLHENASITSLAISPNGYIYATTIFPSKLYRSINPVVFINEPVSSASMLRLFPNPCNNVINIKFGSNYSSDQNYYLEFVNSKGEIVFAKSFYDNGNGIISCNISYLKQGLYFVNIYSNLKLHQGRFVKL